MMSNSENEIQTSHSDVNPSVESVEIDPASAQTAPIESASESAPLSTPIIKGSPEKTDENVSAELEEGEGVVAGSETSYPENNHAETSIEKKNDPWDDPTPPKKSHTWPFVVITVVIAVAGFGVFGEVLGAGWFFYRSILYSSGELYALNLGEKPLWISVDGKESLEVAPNDARIVTILGGKSTVDVRDQATGPIVKSYEITTDHSDAFLKLTKEGCLVVVDLNPYYGKRKGKEIGDIHFTDKLTANDQIWIPNSYNVVWPRKTFPRQLTAGEGPGRWIELVACTLLGDSEDDKRFLDAYIALRLQERMEKALNPPKPTGGVRNKL